MTGRTRGMGRVYRPALSRNWWIQYSVHGKRYRESSGSVNRADAVKLLKQRIAETQGGKMPIVHADRATLDDLLKMLADDYRANGRRSLVRAQQAGIHLRAFFGSDCKVRDITADKITSYAAGRLKEGAAPATVNIETAMMRRSFRLGVRAGKVANRPEFPMLKLNNTRTGFFEWEQFQAISAHLPPSIKPIATVAYITGWRTQSELLTRQWRHVDFQNGWLHLDSGEGKTREGRAFPFTDELRAVLESQRERIRTIEHSTGQIVPWVFAWEDGRRIRDFRRTWKTARIAAGVPARLLHDFRRTAVRNLERAGVSRSASMKMTGHKSESVFRRYAIVDNAMLCEAAQKLNAMHRAEASGEGAQLGHNRSSASEREGR